MNSKPLVKFVLFAALPVIAIILLFKLNTYAGIIGIVLYILSAVWFNRVAIYRLRGQIEYRKGNLQNAVNWFEKAMSIKNAPTDLKVSYGFILLKLGKLDEAGKILSDAVENSKTDDERNLAKSNLALVIWKKGHLDDAIAMLKEVISEYKTTAVYGSLGYMLIEKGDLDEALKFNLEAWEYNSENAIIQDNLAHLYHLRGDMDKAGEIFDKLIAKEPYFPEAYYDYGRFLEDSGRMDEAEKMYRKALSCVFSFNSTITKEQVQKSLEAIAARNNSPEPAP
jgi:tetratricopeptide (TPR) repeat protein